MSACEDFLGRLRGFGPREAMVWRDVPVRFDDLLAQAGRLVRRLGEAGVPAGGVVAVEGDFTPAGVAALLALMEAKAVAVPLTASVDAKKAEFYATAEVEWSLRIDARDEVALAPTGVHASHELLRTLRERDHPGLVLFSSGSTGRSKAVLHDLELLVRKYLQPRHSYRTLAFLLFDHIGGIDTLLYNLANGSCLVAVDGHAPDKVCRAIERHRVEVLPVSPTFLNLLLLGGSHRDHDLGSLRVITYGAEVMPETTLARVREAFPHVKILQKFGTTEVGTLRSQSRDSGSVWVKIGGEGYRTRVREGLLEIQAESAMLGYLNAPSPFTPDGWFMTQDAVEVDGEWMRILGRRSEMINVGGEKVYPAEVEGVLLELPNVVDAVVAGEPNPITGSIVVARVQLAEPEPLAAFRKRMKAFCQERLAPYKVPVRVTLVDGGTHSARQKKMRLQRPG
jgi:acyl-coenzyme A synthetase/AMP-(fatty) acid ligase